MTRRLGLVLAIGLVSGAPARPGTDAMSLCDRAAMSAARETGVPLQILLAVTRTETGRSRNGVLAPWPWTVNHAGRGFWFDDPSTTLDFLRTARTEGAGNIDIGCFQINLHWHGAAFDDLQDMLDPAKNARYAADFLNRLHRELGDWEAAVGAFHSRTPRFSEPYLARYRRIRASLEPVPQDATAPPEAGRGPRPAAVPRALDLRARPGLMTTRERRGRDRAPLLHMPAARPLWEDNG